MTELTELPPDKDGRRLTADWTLTDEEGELHVLEYRRSLTELAPQTERVTVEKRVEVKAGAK